MRSAPRLPALAVPVAAVLLGLAGCETEPGDDDSAAGSQEVCDGVDNDLDGEVDEDVIEGAPIWHPDADLDGYGDLYQVSRGCNAPSGYVADGSDCDDDDPSVHPGVPETCNGIDDDCDGPVDEEPEDAAPWYPDDDGDGYGVDDGVITACAPPFGYAATGDDCDDDDDAVSPGSPEGCEDGIDNDCDGVVDADCSLVGSIDAGGADGVLRGSSSGDALGCAIAAAGDSDGDGLSEVLVGACGYDGGECSGSVDSGCETGAAVLYEADWRDGSGAATAVATLVGTSGYAAAGTSVAGAGDVDGDGVPDLLVGSPYEGTGGAGAGAVYLVFGPVAGTLPLADAGATIVGEGTGDAAGLALAAIGDVDEDGLQDFAVGAPGSDLGGESAGAVFVFLGPVDGVVTAATADLVIAGSLPYGEFGSSLAGGRDADGDGRPDLLIGAPARFEAGAPGAAYLFTALAAGSRADSDAAARFAGETPGDGAGASVAFAGDPDGDGDEDALIGAVWRDGVTAEGGAAPAAGAAYLVRGPLAGETALAGSWASFLGEAEGDLLGVTVAGAGDVDGDGRSDVLLGAPGSDPEGWTGRGLAALYYEVPSGTYGWSSAHAVFLGEQSNDGAGGAVAALGDLDGDGLADFAVGARSNDAVATNAGAAYVFLGMARP